MLQLWSGTKRQRLFVPGAQLAWSVGATLLPFIIRPFLVDIPTCDTSGNDSLTNTTNDVIGYNDIVIQIASKSSDNNSTNYTVSAAPCNIGSISSTPVRYAYMIIGTVTSSVAVLLFFVFVSLKQRCYHKEIALHQNAKSAKNAPFRISRHLYIGLLVITFTYSICMCLVQVVPSVFSTCVCC